MRAMKLVTALAVVLVVLAVPAVAGAAPGDHLWHGTVFNLTGSGDESAVAVATDAAGEPVVVGTAVTSAAGDLDIRYCKYDLAGIWRWTSVDTFWDNPANPGADDVPVGVVVDDARACAYVAGTTTGATGDRDIVLLKVTDGVFGFLPGELAWAITPGTSAGKDDEAEAVALDKYGNVYVTGGAQRADGSMDVYTVKYRPNGTVAWSRRHNNSGSRFDRGLAIAVRGSAVYVAGVSNRRGHGDDLVLIRYSLGGKRAWVRYYDDALNRHEMVSGIATASGTVYVCGAGKFTGTKPGNALLVKYRSDGRRVWVRWAGLARGDDAWTDVAVDAKARAHVTGFLERTATGDDVVTAMYTTAGVRAWQRGLSSGGKRTDVGTALAVEPGGRTYVCGSVTGADGDVDIVAVKYGSKTGSTLWYTFYPEPLFNPTESDVGDDWPTDVALGPTAAYVVGRQVVDHVPGVDADFLAVAIER